MIANSWPQNGVDVLPKSTDYTIKIPTKSHVLWDSLECSWGNLKVTTCPMINILARICFCQKYPVYTIACIPSRPKICILCVLRPTVNEIWLSKVRYHGMTWEWIWTLGGQKYHVYTKCPRSPFLSVSPLFPPPFLKRDRDSGESSINRQFEIPQIYLPLRCARFLWMNLLNTFKVRLIFVLPYTCIHHPMLSGTEKYNISQI